MKFFKRKKEEKNQSEIREGENNPLVIPNCSLCDWEYNEDRESLIFGTDPPVTDKYGIHLCSAIGFKDCSRAHNTDLCKELYQI